MPTRWENVVNLARDVDAAFSAGTLPDDLVVARLARAVVDFQRELFGAGGSSYRPPPSKPSRL